jgi:Protein of unknown function (DUF3592)
MSNFVQLFAPWLMWAGSAVLLWFFVRGLRLRIAMMRWPRVRGVVRKHKVGSHRNLHGPGHHRPIVIVEYSAAGAKRHVRCDSPTRLGFAHREAAESAMTPFAIGKSVELYVDPDNPERAFLYPPETPALVMLSLGSLFLLLVGIGMS